MKGQIRVEFILGIIIFAAIIFFLFSQVITLFSSVSQDSARDSLKGKAITTLTVLLEDMGEPNDWESQPTGSITRIGLADSPYKLNKNKIERLGSECSLLEKYDLGQYRLIIKNSISEILFCGSKSLEPPVVSISKTAIIDGDYASIILEMY